MLGEKITLGSKLEATAYTAATLAAADYDILLKELTYNFDFAEYKRKYLTGYLSQNKTIIGKQGAGCNFVVDLTEPTNLLRFHPVTKLMQACGCREVYHFAETGDNNNQLSGYTGLYGINPTVNTSAAGELFLSIVDDGGGAYHVNFYTETGRTTLVAHTASYTTTGKKKVFADSASGISGYITVNAVTAVDVDITITIDGCYWAPYSKHTTKPITLEVCEPDEGVEPVQLITRIAGAMGNVKIVNNVVGEPIRLEFEFKGRLLTIVDRPWADYIEFNAASEGEVSRVLGATITHNSIEQLLDKFTLDKANSIQMKTRASDNTGWDGAYIESQDSIFSCDPYTRTMAGEPDYTDWRNAVTGVLSGTIGNYKLIADAAQKTNIAPNLRNGSRVYDKTFTLTGVEDNEWRLGTGVIT